MWKKKERWTAAALLLAMVVVTGLCWYILYIRQQFYDEGTRNLLETYEQVDKAFTIFSRSNWNMLNEWGKSLQAANEEGLAEERLRSYEAEREIWRYSSVYLFNENCEYWSIRGKHEKVDHLWTAFEEMYRIVAAADCLFLFLDFHTVKVGDFPLDRLDRFVVVDTLNVQIDDNPVFRFHEVGKHTV